MLILCWEVQSQGSKREERGVWHGEGGPNTRGRLANQSPLGIKRNWPQVSQELLQRDRQVEEGRRISPWAFVFYWSEVQALTPPHFRVTHPWMTHFSGNREASLWKAELCGISLRWATLGHAHCHADNRGGSWAEPLQEWNGMSGWPFRQVSPEEFEGAHKFEGVWFLRENFKENFKAYGSVKGKRALVFKTKFSSETLWNRGENHGWKK